MKVAIVRGASKPRTELTSSSISPFAPHALGGDISSGSSRYTIITMSNATSTYFNATISTQAAPLPQSMRQFTRRIPLFQVDAFTATPFGGNPAAVMLMPFGLGASDTLLCKIAAENNLSETAFVEPISSSTADSFELGEKSRCPSKRLASVVTSSVFLFLTVVFSLYLSYSLSLLVSPQAQNSSYDGSPLQMRWIYVATPPSPLLK